MTRTDFLADLRALEAMFDSTIVITRTIVNGDGREVGRVQRIALNRGPEPPQKKGITK